MRALSDSLTRWTSGRRFEIFFGTGNPLGAEGDDARKGIGDVMKVDFRKRHHTRRIITEECDIELAPFDELFDYRRFVVQVPDQSHLASQRTVVMHDGI